MGPLDLFSFTPVPFTLANGKTVHFKRLTAADKTVWLDALGEGDSTATVSLNHQAFLLQKTLCNETGVCLFDGVDAVKQIDGVTLDVLLVEAMRVNGMGKEGAEAVEKKPESGPTGTAS